MGGKHDKAGYKPKLLDWDQAYPGRVMLFTLPVFNG